MKTLKLKQDQVKSAVHFPRLQLIWKAARYSRKKQSWKNNVETVVLYGSECWCGTKSDMKTLSVFHNNRLSRTCCIFWPEKILNTELYKKTNSRSVEMKIRRRRKKWLGVCFPSAILSQGRTDADCSVFLFILYILQISKPQWLF